MRSLVKMDNESIDYIYGEIMAQVFVKSLVCDLLRNLAEIGYLKHSVLFLKINMPQFFLPLQRWDQNVQNAVVTQPLAWFFFT